MCDEYDRDEANECTMCDIHALCSMNEIYER